VQAQSLPSATAASHGVAEALCESLARLAEIDAAFEKKVKEVDGWSAPLPAKARILREYEEDCRVRRDPYLQALATLQRQHRQNLDCASDEHHEEPAGSHRLTAVSRKSKPNPPLAFSHERAPSTTAARARRPVRQNGFTIRRWLPERQATPASVMAAASLLLCFAVVLTARPSLNGRHTPHNELVAAADQNVLPETKIAVFGRPVLDAVPKSESGAERETTLAEAASLDSFMSPTQIAESEPVIESVSGLEPQPEPSRPFVSEAKVANSEPTTRTAIAAEPAAATAVFGTWAANAKACRRGPTNLIPAVIDNAGARAGDTFCAFTKKRLDRNGLSVVATCSNSRERWVANVRLVVEGDHLRWSSQRGSQTYVRCGETMRVASTH